MSYYQMKNKGGMIPSHYIGDYCFYHGDDLDVDESKVGGKITRPDVLKLSDVRG